MRTAWITAGIVIALASPVAAWPQAPAARPLAQDEGERRILAVMEEMQKTGSTHLAVPVADGRALRLLTEAVAARSVVEIGTSTGFSGLWFALALRKTGGKLTTFELDPGRAAAARRYFRSAGVDDIVTVVVGNAHANIRKLPGPIDVVFIDAEKEGYVDYLEQLLPRVRPGGLVLAHNTTMAAVAEGYVRAVTADPALETVFFTEGAGLSVTLKKR